MFIRFKNKMLANADNKIQTIVIDDDVKHQQLPDMKESEYTGEHSAKALEERRIKRILKGLE